MNPSIKKFNIKQWVPLVACFSKPRSLPVCHVKGGLISLPAPRCKLPAFFGIHVTTSSPNEGVTRYETFGYRGPQDAK